MTELAKPAQSDGLNSTDIGQQVGRFSNPSQTDKWAWPKAIGFMVAVSGTIWLGIWLLLFR